MSEIERLLEWNRNHHEGAAHPGVLASPSTGVAVVTCMDARILPTRVLGIGPGDVHVIRNAGGIVTDDVLRSLVISQVALGTREVMVIQHTHCGLEGLVDAELSSRIAEERGARPELTLGGFADAHDRVAESVATLRACPYLRGTVRGFVLDVDTGSLREVS